MNSILTDVKGFLNLSIETTDFDGEVLPHVSAAIAKLAQNGVCQYTLVDGSTTWVDVMPPEHVRDPAWASMTPLYVMLSTKILFDPPPPSTIPYYQSNIDELLWRLNVIYETSEVIINE